MYQTTERMIKLWADNREWIKRRSFRVPSLNDKDGSTSFAKFKDKWNYERMSSTEYWSSTDKQRDRAFEATWPGRRMNHYDYSIKGGKIVENLEIKYFPKDIKTYAEVNPETGKRIVKKEVRDALWIKPSKTALLKGIVPFAVGHQPQKYVNQDSRWKKFLGEHYTQKYPYDPIMLERIRVGGAWPTQKVDFQKLCDPVQYDVNYEGYLRAIAVRGHKILLPSLPKPTIDNVMLAKTNPKSYSGVVCSRWFGRSHKIADKRMRPVAVELFKKVTSKVMADTSLWGVGGRSRLQKKWKDGPLRSRSLLMPEGVIKILGLATIQPCYDALSQINFNNAENEIRIGGNDFHGSYFSHSEKWADGSEIVEADIGCHDGNTQEEAMVVSFGIVRSMFPPGKDMDLLFLYHMSGFIFKNVVVPGRFVYRCLKGIPTGSPFTSIIVSLVNWLNWSAVLAKDCSPVAAADSDIAVFGDDTLVKPSKLCPPKMWCVDYWTRTFKSYIGHDLDPCKLVNSSLEDNEDKPSFLKVVPLNGLPARQILDTILFCSTIRQSNNSDLRYANVIKTLQYSGPFNPVGAQFLKDFRYFLLVRHLNSLPLSCQPTDNYRYARLQCDISQRASEKQYLFPFIFGWDVVKNVDLGNKPKSYSGSKFTKDNDILVRTMCERKYLAYEWIDPDLPSTTPAQLPEDSPWFGEWDISGASIEKSPGDRGY